MALLYNYSPTFNNEFEAKYFPILQVSVWPVNFYKNENVLSKYT